MWYTIVLLLIAHTSSAEEAGTATQEHIISTNLLPSRRVCGYQHSDDYFHAENDTPITSFPWMAILLYASDEQYFIIGCTGSLINSKYVLTSAYCTQTNIRGHPIGVRLGDYHLKNKTDCTDDSRVHECSEPVKDYQIEKIIPHPKFVNRTFTNNLLSIARNDIALIRLNGSVMYTEEIGLLFVKGAICKKARVGDVLVLPSWEIFPYHDYLTKKQLYTKLIVDTECLTANNIIMRLEESQMCGKALDDHVNSICSGSVGGPLLYYRTTKLQWYQQGILSFLDDGRYCFVMDYTVEVFTRVEFYLDWIVENIEP